jgi:hypothetical protein
MPLKNQIKLILEKYLKEYVTKDIVYLKDYFTMSKEKKKESLVYEYYDFFNDFLEETETYFERPTEKRESLYMDEPDEDVEMFESDDELMYWLKENNEEVFNKFADYLYEKITTNELPVNESEYPAWVYYDDEVEIIKNQWLIHFTNDADSVAKEGFKYGVSDMDKLGLTTSLSDFYKKYGGYNFAFLLSDYKKYSVRSYVHGGGYKYGSEAVIFRASGLKVYHYGDEEHQVIFYGNTAKNIIPIVKGEITKYALYSKDNRLLYENDNLDKIVSWIINNYSQYRKQFAYK